MFRKVLAVLAGRVGPDEPDPDEGRLPDTVDGLTFAQEGRDVRVTNGSLNFLFTSSDRRVVLAAYTTYAAAARDYFGGRWRTLPQPHLPESVFHAITTKATLHWMYFYIVNRKKVRITDDDWAHPQTIRIVQDAVASALTNAPEQSVTVCAHLTGMTREAFLSWRRGDELFHSR